MQDKDCLEARFWWAFSCLAVAGRRSEEDFRAEVARRSAGFYPDAVGVDSILREACCDLALVPNPTEASDATGQRKLSGWERHLLALSARPGD
jgi:hypothetical protein